MQKCGLSDGLLLRCEEAEKYQDPKKDLRGLEALVFGGTAFSLKGGRANEDGFTTDGVAIPVRLDDATNSWNVALGWKGKKVLHDVFHAVAAPLGRDPLSSDKKDTAMRELFVDAISLDLSYGFGRTAKRLADRSRRLDDRSTFRVEAKYEIKLDALYAHVTRLKW